MTYKQFPNVADFPLTFLLQVKNQMGQGISQATGQIKGLGTAMDKASSTAKQTSIGLGSAISLITSNLVNTAEAMIGLKRQYEDLTRKQNDVKQSGFSLANAQNMLKTATDKLTAAQKGKSGATQRQIQEARMQFKEDMKNAKSKLDVMKAQDKLNKVLNQGGIDTDKVAAAQRRVENLTRRVASATINQKEAQIDLNRATEDFYLQTIPVAIGLVGSFAGVLQVAQGVGGIGGLTSSILKFSPIMIGLGIAFAAFKTNFLGFGDAVRGFIQWVTQSKDSWAAGFKSLVDNIMKGNWNGAFDVIKSSAIAFWNDIKKRVPLFGGIALIIEDIRKGKWAHAFEIIRENAIGFWTNLKKAIPLFGDLETIITAIASGNWSKAFNAIKQAWVDTGIPKMITDAIGKDRIEKIISEITVIPEKLKALQNAPGKGPKNPFAGTWLDQIIGLNDWSPEGFWKAFLTKLSMGFNLSKGGGKGGELWGDNPNPPGKQIADSIGKNAALFVRNAVDPFVASLFDAKTWSDAMATINKTHPLTDAWNFLIGALFPKDQKTGKPGGGFQAQVDDVANQIVSGIADFFTSNMSKTGKKVAGISKIVTSFWNVLKITWDQIPGPSALFMNIVNGIIKGITDLITFDNVGKVVHKIVTTLTNAASQVKDDFVRIGERFWGWIWQGLLGAGGALLRFGQSIGIIPQSGSSSGGSGSRGRGAGRAAGFHGMTTGPMIIGERATEHYDVTPMSDWINRRNNSGGNDNRPLIIYVTSVLDGRIVAESVAYKINRNASTYR